jgi:hypothetical protein
MYVVVSLEYLEKFILPIDEKSGRYRYSCPIFTIADVEKKKKDDKGGERVVRRRASDSTTWKRKESKEDVVSQVKSLAELKGRGKKLKLRKMKPAKGVKQMEVIWEWRWLALSHTDRNDSPKLELLSRGVQAERL